jgi:hypothetical protein
LTRFPARRYNLPRKLRDREGLSVKSPLWQQQVFHYFFIACGLFVVLTFLAMLTYPGGTVTDGTTVGYSFFRNFFSDLGRVTAANGQPNRISMILFFTAETVVGIGMVFFFIAFREFFKTDRTGKWVSLFGTVVGIASGLCFAGVAFAPADLYLGVHIQLVLWAYRTFLVSVATYAYVIFRQNDYPRRYGWIFIIFTIFLAAYLMLSTYGPGPLTPAGIVIQAAAQKIIVYVSVVSVMAQAWLAYRFRFTRAAAEPRRSADTAVV